MSDALTSLKNMLAVVADINRAVAVLDWDQETYVPPGGVQGRAEQLSTLSELAHVRFTSDEVGRLLDQLEGDAASQPFDSDEASLVRVTRRDYELARKLPDELAATFAQLKSAIVPLVADIARHADAVDDSVLHRGFDPDKQVQYALHLVARLGYDLERGRQDISTHPFSISFGP